MNENFATSKYSEPPTKSDLEKRIAEGELIRGFEAIIAAEDFKLGKLIWPMHEKCALIPHGESTTSVVRKLKEER